MVYHPSSNSAQRAQDETQSHAAIQGYAWQSGAAVSLGSSSTSIETTVDSGTVLFNGQLVDVASTTLTHSSGDSADPRWDAVVVTDNSGTVEIISGPPAPPAQTDDGTVLRGEEAWSPAPEDTISTDVVILALVWIPAGATATADLTNTSAGGVNEPIVDRRLPAPGRAKHQRRTATITSSGWYRIASNGPVADGGSGGDRAHAMFTVHSPQSAIHSSTTFYASVQYGNRPTLTLLSRSHTSDGAVQQIRLVDGGTTEGAAVEVYIALGGQSQVSVNYSIFDNHATTGWTPVAWDSGSVPTNFTTTKLDIIGTDPVMSAAANGTDDMFVVHRNGDLTVDGSVSATSKTFSGIVDGGHSDFSSAQGAIDWAQNNGYREVHFPAGSYGQITVPYGMAVIGPGHAPDATETAYFDAGSNGNAITLKRSARIQGLAAGSDNTDAIDATNNAFRIEDCWMRKAGANGVWINAAYGVIRGCLATSGNISDVDISLGSSSQQCSVIGNSNVTLNDVGTSNKKVGNT